MRAKTLFAIGLLALSAGAALAAIQPPSARPAAKAESVQQPDGTTAKASAGESWKGRAALYSAMIRWLSVSRKDALAEFQSGVYAALQQAVTDEVPDALCDYGILLMNGVFFEKDLAGGYAEIVRAAKKGSDLAGRIVKEVEK